MDDIRNAIASCCKQLRLSSNLADRAMTQEGDTNQEYLYHLLKNEIENRRQTRITKLRNNYFFKVSYKAFDNRICNFLCVGFNSIGCKFITT